MESDLVTLPRTTDTPTVNGSSDSFYVGIDVGTGSARACIIDSKGEIVGLASQDIKTWNPQPDHYEQSTSNIWKSIGTSIRSAIKEANINSHSIRGMAFDATCSLAAFNLTDDEPISVTVSSFESERNVILWLDHRAVEETEKINATGHSLLRYVGGQMSVEMEIPKILWLKNNMKEKFSQYKFYDLADALTYMATGNDTRSFCSTVCKQGYVPIGVDNSTKGWQEDFFKEIGLDDFISDEFARLGGVDGMNGKYLSAGELAGYLTEKAAEELGLVPGIPVGGGVIDAYAGWIGTVGANVDSKATQANDILAENVINRVFSRLAAVAGTSTCHLVMSPNPIFVPGVWGPYKNIILPGQWMAEGGQSATGHLLKHVVETHPAFSKANLEASAKGVSIYEYLNGNLREQQLAQNLPHLSVLAKHFYYYGDIFGNRSPLSDPAMTGCVIGLTSDVSVNSLALHYYGCMEFIAFQTKQIIDAMTSKGHTIDSIFMSGSQCQNDILMHLIATICGIPVVIPKYINAAVVHGAAILGAKAGSVNEQGHTEDLWVIMNRMSKPGRCVYPGEGPMELKLLETKYKIFLRQCFDQLEFRKMVDLSLKEF